MLIYVKKTCIEKKIIHEKYLFQQFVVNFSNFRQNNSIYEKKIMHLKILPLRKVHIWTINPKMQWCKRIAHLKKYHPWLKIYIPSITLKKLQICRFLIKQHISGGKTMHLENMNSEKFHIFTVSLEFHRFSKK